ncbi:MAG: hypothetical protein ACOH2N_11220 [Devosia sp.]
MSEDSDYLIAHAIQDLRELFANASRPGLTPTAIKPFRAQLTAEDAEVFAPECVVIGVVQADYPEPSELPTYHFLTLVDDQGEIYPRVTESVLGPLPYGPTPNQVDLATAT